MASTLLVAGDRLLGAASGKVDYRRTDDGWFEFDSVGLNGWDDKGVPGSNRAEEQPEWLWPEPARREQANLF